MKVSERTYNPQEVITFSNTKGRFGGLSNMAPNYPLFVNEINIPTTEALYQACRFPIFPQIQQEIILQNSPIEAKNISRKYTQYTRQDWENVKFHIMKWCLEIKLLQNWETFSELLLSTNNKQIVEYSTKDAVWGAIPDTQGNLIGKNALGRLLMELRENIIKNNFELQQVNPPKISAFLLFDNEITTTYKPEFYFAEFAL
jgi:ribA/ribD-fused uncharacterized protein